MTVKWLYKYDEKYNYMPGEEIQVEETLSYRNFIAK